MAIGDPWPQQQGRPPEVDEFGRVFGGGGGPEPPNYEDLVRRLAGESGVRPDLAISLVRRESAFNPRAVSQRGAQGLMQLMPDTARRLGVADPFNAEANLRGGMRHFKSLLDRYQGDERRALAAYNAGEAAVDQAGGVPRIPETQAYVDAILGQAPGAQPSPPPEVDEFGKVYTAAGKATSISGQQPPGTGAPLDVQAAARAAAGRAVGAVNPAAIRQTPPSFEAARRGLGLSTAAVVRGFDYRTPEGQRNIVAAIAAALMGAATGGVGMATGMGRILLNNALRISAAAAGGGMTAAVQQGLGGAPPWKVAQEAGWAGLRQGLYEAGGQLAWMPFGMIGRRAMGPRVARGSIAKMQGTLTGLEKEAERLGKEYRALEQGPGILAAPTTTQQAGRAALEAFKPAGRQLNTLGATLREVAETGPEVNIQGVKAEIARMAKEMTPTVQPGSATMPPPRPGSAAAEMLARGGQDAEDMRAMLGLSADDPLPDIISQIRTLPDVIPMRDAHIWKRRLYEAVNWNRPAKSQTEGATKGVSLALDRQLDRYDPYRLASEEYKRAHVAIREGIAPDLVKEADTNPERIVALIKEQNPTELEQFRDVFLSYAPAGGDLGSGRVAWDKVRDAYIRDRILKETSVASIPKRLHDMNDQFREVLFGDQAGQAVERNLTRLGEAFAEIEKIKKPALAEQARQLKEAFHTATIGSPEQVYADLLRFIALGPTQIWGALSGIRLLRTAAQKDLVRWAAYSDARTSKLITFLTSPAPSLVAADLIRMPGLIEIISGALTGGAPPGPPVSGLPPGKTLQADPEGLR